MKTALKILATIVVGAALGLFATWIMVFRGEAGDIGDGPWKTNLLIGSSGGGLYTRASVAVHGLLALNRSETIYYSAMRDGAGDRFDGACSYLISGRDPSARWWSITAYGTDDFLIPNPAKRYSISRTSLIRDAGGGFVATVSPKPLGPNAIATNGHDFSLTLRLYNPSSAVVADPAHAALPAIKKVSCP